MKSKRIVYVIMILIITFAFNVKSYAVTVPNLEISSNNYLDGDKMTLDEENEVQIGEELQLYAMIVYGNDLADPDNPDSLGWYVQKSNLSNITWESSNTSIATINNQGKLKGIKEGTTTVTATYNSATTENERVVTREFKVIKVPSSEDNFTDFSKAEISLEKENAQVVCVKVKNVNWKKNHHYYVKIEASKEANITTQNADVFLTETKESGVYKTTSITKYVELNQDIYLYVLERDDNGEEKIVVDGKKLEKISEPRYADAFFATHMTKSGTQIVTNFSHDSDFERKMQIKVGKITDINILKKIKNQEKSGFQELLSYAKNTQGLFDRNVKCKSSAIEYSSYKDGNSVLDVQGLEQDSYYFLYVKTDDENGKYVSNEAVTLAQASIPNGEWFLFFYGDDSFKWTEWADNDEQTGDGKNDDNTIVPDKVIPQTGENTAIVMSVLAVICIGGALTYMAYRKNNYK